MTRALSFRWFGPYTIDERDGLTLRCALPPEFVGKRIVSARCYWTAEHDCPSDLTMVADVDGHLVTPPNAHRPETEWQYQGEFDLTPWVRDRDTATELALTFTDLCRDSDNGVVVEAGIALTIDEGFRLTRPDPWHAGDFAADEDGWPVKLTAKKRGVR